MGKVSELLNKSIKSFLELGGGVSLHIDSRENPHSVTKEQVGLSNVENARQATRAEFEEHRSRLDHPDGSVTDEKIGARIFQNPEADSGETANTLTNILNIFAGAIRNVRRLFAEHESDNSNPHSVTSAQVGLSNVINQRQATKAEYDAHVSGGADKHTADSIIYEGTTSVKAAIDAIDAGSGGTFNHNALQNRDMDNQHPISSITGLNDALGIVFEGVTTDGTATEILADPSVYSVDQNGRFFLPLGQAAAIEVNVVGVHMMNGIACEAQAWHIKGMALYYGEMGALMATGDVTHTKTPNTQDWNVSVTNYLITTPAFKIMVSGEEGKTIYWRAALRVLSLLDAKGVQV